MRSTRSPTPSMSVANLSLNSVNVQVRSAGTGSKKKGKRLCRSVECTLMDTTRLSQRRPRRPPSRSKLSRHYPRPVAGHDPWSLSEQGRRGSKFPFSASFRSASPPTPPSSLPPPPLPSPPIPLCSSYTHHSPPRYAMRPMGGGGRVSAHHRTPPRHCSSRVVGFVRKRL